MLVNPAVDWRTVVQQRAYFKLFALALKIVPFKAL